MSNTVLGQGGFSNELWENEQVKDYINEFGDYGGGRIGTSNRNIETDKILESKRPGTKDELANFIVSKRGRWFGEAIDGDLEEYLEREVIKYYNRFTIRFNK